MPGRPPAPREPGPAGIGRHRRPTAAAACGARSPPGSRAAVADTVAVAAPDWNRPVYL